eukprot:Blabericola_migrator_1__3038@NODE_1884_length_3608_cov_125_962440_g29_i1_p3_GENE_NODE_1884_length_3608_cov_125_962440_g29_i1NODE_1884_length_3608_cov_125_962440_g29_i1_p3_ORF_typecomplete_len308_score44_00_NODE_1884_length_3608_cov_125_962440_g29_i114102333
MPASACVLVNERTKFCKNLLLSLGQAVVVAAKSSSDSDSSSSSSSDLDVPPPQHPPQPYPQQQYYQQPPQNSQSPALDARTAAILTAVILDGREFASQKAHEAALKTYSALENAIMSAKVFDHVNRLTAGGYSVEPSQTMMPQAAYVTAPYTQAAMMPTSMPASMPAMVPPPQPARQMTGFSNTNTSGAAFRPALVTPQGAPTTHQMMPQIMSQTMPQMLPQAMPQTMPQAMLPAQQQMTPAFAWLPVNVGLQQQSQIPTWYYQLALEGYLMSVAKHQLDMSTKIPLAYAAGGANVARRLVGQTLAG